MYNRNLRVYTLHNLGQWKQWNSDVGVVSNCMCFVIAHCSAQVKGLAFTGYSATPKTGIVTKMNGPRHIISIDNQPAGRDWSTKFATDKWTFSDTF